MRGYKRNMKPDKILQTDRPRRTQTLRAARSWQNKEALKSQKYL
jgi:hypothetical protein